MRIELDVDDEQVAFLASALKFPSDGNGRQEALQRFCAFSLEIVTEWMKGTTRPRTLTEQYIVWLTKIYEEFFPDEIPSATHLYNHLSIPYGQAQYIARVLNENSIAQWRIKGKQHLLNALNKKKTDAEEEVKGNSPDLGISVIVHKNCGIELARVYTELRQVTPDVFQPKKKAAFADDVEFEIPAETLLKTIEFLEQEIQESSDG